MILWLQGPSGAGKTTVGRILAERRSIPFVDLDSAIEAETGKSVLDIFWSDGEAAFRTMEWNMLLSIVEEDRSPKVIALGGGAVADPSIREMMRTTGLRITLDVDGESALARLAQDTPRPLLFEEDPLAAWQRLYGRRLGFYRDADLTVQGDSDPETIAKTIDLELQNLTEPAWSIRSSVADQSCEVSSFRSLFVLFQQLQTIVAGRPLCVVTDSGLLSGYNELLTGIRGDLLLLTVDPGEENKSLPTVERFVSHLANRGFGRDGIIIGIGGGVVTDLAGFLSSIYMRGVESIYIPTTLLAQVDAAIGGKTAINAAGVRNLVGTFKQPGHVLVSRAFLRSLSHRELRSGFVESLKMGIANSSELAGAVERAMPGVIAGEIDESLEEVVRLSISTKLDVVEHDLYDTSLRLSLNLGHTFGHALEAVEPGIHTHGEAVAFGLIASAEMAYDLGRISEERREWIASRALSFTNSCSGEHSIPRLLRAIGSDKKRLGAEVRFVLPREETGVEIYPTSDMKPAAEAIERAFSRIDGRE